MTYTEIIGIAHGSPLAAISHIRIINPGRIDEREIVNFYIEHRMFKEGRVYKITIQEIETDDC